MGPHSSLHHPAGCGGTGGQYSGGNLPEVDRIQRGMGGDSIPEGDSIQRGVGRIVFKRCGGIVLLVPWKQT